MPLERGCCCCCCCAELALVLQTGAVAMRCPADGAPLPVDTPLLLLRCCSDAPCDSDAAWLLLVGDIGACTWPLPPAMAPALPLHEAAMGPSNGMAAQHGEFCIDPTPATPPMPPARLTRLSKYARRSRDIQSSARRPDHAGIASETRGMHARAHSCQPQPLPPAPHTLRLALVGIDIGHPLPG